MEDSAVFGDHAKNLLETPQLSNDNENHVFSVQVPSDPDTQPKINQYHRLSLDETPDFEELTATLAKSHTE